MSHPLFTMKMRDAVKAAAPLFCQAHVLRVLHTVHWPEIERIRERRQALLNLTAYIAACAENGKVAVVESGRDCDGVQYSGHVRIIDATMAAYRELESGIADWNYSADDRDGFNAAMDAFDGEDYV